MHRPTRRPTRPVPDSSAGRILRRRIVGWAGSLAAAAVLAGALPPSAPAQEELPTALESPVSGLNISAVRSLLARGDAAAAGGNLEEARRLYDQARDASRKLLGFYRDLSGAFRGLDARIPREMDDKGRQALELLTETNLRLAALFRRQNQPEVAVPLLVEVVRTMTPAKPEGRQAYQQLIELGFVSTPYTAPAASPGS